ncbi:hypothetical protein [Enterococcus faecalis]|uniref:hypothetical protein n=1 Tax=Enterococcus faecalis TaxID=1351 RepID=UPI003D2D38CE
MHELIKEIERQLEMDRIEANMSAEDILYIVKGFKRPYLNENQQVVLDWLKKHFYKEDDNYPLVSVCRFVEEDTGDEFSDVGLAYGYLTMKQEAQVLLAFANWTMEQVEE